MIKGRSRVGLASLRARRKNHYFRPVPKFDMEIVALDLNHFQEGWDRTLVYGDLGLADCQYTPCEETCLPRAKARSEASMDLFWDRHEKSKAKNLLVFSHYPTDFFDRGDPKFLRGLRNKTAHDIVYFGGHRHSTDIREYSSIRSTASGFLRKYTGANGRTRFSTNTYRNIGLFLQKSPSISGSLREFTGGCNL